MKLSQEGNVFFDLGTKKVMMGKFSKCFFHLVGWITIVELFFDVVAVEPINEFWRNERGIVNKDAV
jgi:hypothetical protein